LLHAYRNDSSVTHAFIIDHALRGGSAKEARQAAEIATSFGYATSIDRWQHDGVSSGIQAKARDYRYAALGRMCRAAGVKHLITAHTADDQAETLLMRLDRQTGWRGLAGMPKTAYAPLWPALADVYLHRPWLDKSRAELRKYNQQHGLSFVDDPSNENRDFARIRARQALAADPQLRMDLLQQQKDMRARLSIERRQHGTWLAEHARVYDQGYIETDAIPRAELLLHILNSAAGRGGPIDATKRMRLRREMESPDFKAATLGGAWVVRKMTDNTATGSHGFVFLRDRVAVSGRTSTQPLTPTSLNPDEWIVWDGRFLCRAKQMDLRVEAGFGHLQKLRQLPEFKPLFELPKDVRESLPIFFRGETALGYGACETEYVSAISTSALRLQALFGEM